MDQHLEQLLYSRTPFSTSDSWSTHETTVQHCGQPPCCLNSVSVLEQLFAPRLHLSTLLSTIAEHWTNALDQWTASQPQKTADSSPFPFLSSITGLIFALLFLSRWILAQSFTNLVFPSLAVSPLISVAQAWNLFPEVTSLSSHSPCRVWQDALVPAARFFP